MKAFIDNVSQTSYVSAIVARKRLLFGVSLVFLILIAISLTETEDPNWTHGSGRFSHITAHNGTLGNSTFPYGSGGPMRMGAGYQRPGYERPLANGLPLRIMAIGASTTRGDEGFDNNGFRRPVRDYLTSIGNPVNFVGPHRVGNMTDNDIEAWPGARTEVMHHRAEHSLPFMKPNLVLANLGSNDCFQNFDIPNFYKRYYRFVEYVLEASPRATLIMGTLLPTTETKRFNAGARVVEVNKQLRRLYKIFQKEKRPVVLAEMMGPDGIHPENLGPDLMHPNDAGYEMMGRIIVQAIIEADAKGFLRPAEPVYGILQDGNLERQDDAYKAWAEAKRLEEAATKEEEEAAVAGMEAELKKYMAEIQAHEQQSALAARSDDPPPPGLA
ncbi:carbohydrate esterase family 3 protein [Apiospora hydei]|uniref:Carbohydrate esterase family 3 protein n=1 Tax=Apiospora hydei TaxID=1337664 RepID=A0ABR1WL86_9PEZI